jgi:hypothetical protein
MKMCEPCSYSSIGNIEFHKMSVQKCSDCGIIRMPVNSYDRLMYNCAYENNVGGIKKAINLNSLPKKKLEEITEFYKVISFDSFDVKRRRSRSMQQL